jgi:hypothetical protein
VIGPCHDVVNIQPMDDERSHGVPSPQYPQQVIKRTRVTRNEQCHRPTRPAISPEILNAPIVPLSKVPEGVVDIVHFPACPRLCLVQVGVPRRLVVEDESIPSVAEKRFPRVVRTFGWTSDQLQIRRVCEVCKVLLQTLDHALVA